MATTITIPDFSTAYSWLKSNWGSIAALAAALTAAFFPTESSQVQSVLTVISALLGAGAVSTMTARSAMKAEARKLGLIRD